MGGGGGGARRCKPACSTAVATNRLPRNSRFELFMYCTATCDAGSTPRMGSSTTGRSEVTGSGMGSSAQQLAISIATAPVRAAAAGMPYADVRTDGSGTRATATTIAATSAPTPPSSSCRAPPLLLSGRAPMSGCDSSGSSPAELVAAGASEAILAERPAHEPHVQSRGHCRLPRRGAS